MFRSFAVASVLASVALAQTTPQNPLIPTGISADCSSFLTTLNSDSGIASCLTALNTATAAFAPGSTTPSSQAISTALTSVCSDSTTNACPEATIRSNLADFWSKCQADLTGTPNKSVQEIYEVLYDLVPFTQSLCSKNDNGDFCALAPPTTARDVSDAVGKSSLSVSQLLSLLYTTDSAALKRRAEVPVVLPNLGTFHDANIPFLFVNANLDVTNLCSTCTKQVLTAYMTFESNSQFGPGLSNSLLLNTQSALLDAVKAKCPATFLGNAIQAAGGISSSKFFGGAVPSQNVERSGVIALLLGAATLVVAL